MQGISEYNNGLNLLGFDILSRLGELEEQHNRFTDDTSLSSVTNNCEMKGSNFGFGRK